MFFDGVGIGGYRSFGAEVQRIGPLGKLNLIIGPNNSGKSNILRFLVRHFPQLILSLQRQRAKSDFDLSLDRHMGGNGVVRLELGVQVGGTLYQSILERLDVIAGDSLLESIQQVYSALALPKNPDFAWFPPRGHPCEPVTCFDFPTNALLRIINRVIGM